MAGPDPKSLGQALTGSGPELRQWDPPWYQRIPYAVTDAIYGPNANARQAAPVINALGVNNPFNVPAQAQESGEMIGRGVKFGDPATAGLGGLGAILSMLGLGRGKAATNQLGRSMSHEVQAGRSMVPYKEPPVPALTQRQAAQEIPVIEPEIVSGRARFDPNQISEMRSPHWPTSWFEDYSTGSAVPIPRSQWDQSTVERAKLFVRDMHARDREREIINPLMYPNGKRAMSRLEAEREAMKNPQHRQVLEDSYATRQNFYEHTHPNWRNDPYSGFNYPRPPGDDSAFQQMLSNVTDRMQRLANQPPDHEAIGRELMK